MDLEDAKIIESIQLSRHRLVDHDGWHFTTNGKYTVKSGYQVEQVYPDGEISLPMYGPAITPLRAYSWNVFFPPKIKHFLWQLVSGCISVQKKLRTRGMQGDVQCVRWGASKESINHVFFECPPVVQV